MLNARGGARMAETDVMAAALFALTILVVVYLVGMRRSG